jgi:hypothetical protein
MNKPSYNAEAYEILLHMDFTVQEVLRIFGTEIWENNSSEFEAFSEDEVVSTFVRLMLDQVSSLYAIAPST